MKKKHEMMGMLPPGLSDDSDLETDEVEDLVNHVIENDGYISSGDDEKTQTELSDSEKSKLKLREQELEKEREKEHQGILVESGNFLIDDMSEELDEISRNLNKIGSNAHKQKPENRIHPSTPVKNITLDAQAKKMRKLNEEMERDIYNIMSIDDSPPKQPIKATEPKVKESEKEYESPVVLPKFMEKDRLEFIFDLNDAVAKSQLTSEERTSLISKLDAIYNVTNNSTESLRIVKLTQLKIETAKIIETRRKQTEESTGLSFPKSIYADRIEKARKMNREFEDEQHLTQGLKSHNVFNDYYNRASPPKEWIANSQSTTRVKQKTKVQRQNEVQTEEEQLAIAMSLSLMDQNNSKPKENPPPNPEKEKEENFEWHIKNVEKTGIIYRFIQNHADFKQCRNELIKQYLEVNNLVKTNPDEISTNKIKEYINNVIPNEINKYYQDPIHYPKVRTLNKLIHLAAEDIKNKEMEKKKKEESQEYLEQQELLLKLAKSNSTMKI